ncbi:DENN domain-containing protein [Perilla frutescens var. hirtella]|nr:DENN domain-containing protein [Perilla frutescens var. hirtella]
MESKDNGDVQDDWGAPPSPIEVLQQLSQEAVRMAGEAWHHAYQVNEPVLESAPRHRRSRSDIVNSFHKRNGSTSNFQRLKCHMQRALHLGGRCSRDDSQYSSFDPEILANQKRQWYQLNSKTLGTDIYEEPTSLFEHFVVVGLHPETKLEFVEDAYIRGKKFEQEMKRTEYIDFNMQQLRQPKFPTLEPQILFMYPPRKKLALHLKDLAAFCFPAGVKARVLERSPSLSELNELVYGQEHLSRDDLSFIFSLKVAGNATLYGVCLQVPEIVQRLPAIYGTYSPLPQSNFGGSRFLVSAPRCYCMLTRVPLFELHYEMLNSMISLERLNRITKFVSEMALVNNVPSQSISKNHLNVNSPGAESGTDWMASAIPVDHAVTLAAAAAGIISDEEALLRCGNCTGSARASDASDQCQTRDLDKDGSKNMHSCHDSTSENLENQSDGVHTTDVTSDICHRNKSVESLRSLDSLFSPARSMALDDDSYSQDEDPSDDIIMEWARENKKDLLQIVCGYHCLKVPERGKEIVFKPLEHMQSIEYQRPSLSDLGLCEKYLDRILNDSKEDSQVKLKLANAEEAFSLSLWSTATICRVLSLDTILTLITGVLLERQILVMCPNLGILSAVVLSIIPIIRPFEWQSLFLPILPARMVDFLDAPVPFIVGIKHRLPDMRTRPPNLVQLNVLKDQVRSCNLPQLPQHKELISELRPIHYKLSCDNSIAPRHPVYKCNEVQAGAATQFLTVMRRYMDSLCSDLRLHTITNVQSNTEKVSLLLKDSFIYSFHTKDQPFVKFFVETQLFTVLSDSRLLSYENE